eukprot:TRINITY_DN6608_c0_g2_i1.p1 TRINITY_DN6608_c0_g2~~TRINITY_DN6608_c0_g2_i1.p1  ORF type:complete len:2257 (+),score=478.04 TRINITY_DN6608_c0_g2_i1:104-6772(+)
MVAPTADPGGSPLQRKPTASSAYTSQMAQDPLARDATRLKRSNEQTEVLKERFRLHRGGDTCGVVSGEAASNFLKIMRCLELGEEEPRQKDVAPRSSVGAVLDHYHLVAVERPELRMQVAQRSTTPVPGAQGRDSVTVVEPQSPGAQQQGAQHGQQGGSQQGRGAASDSPGRGAPRKRGGRQKDDQSFEQICQDAHAWRRNLERVRSAPPEEASRFHGKDYIAARSQMKREIAALRNQVQGITDTPEVRAMRKQVVELAHRIDNQQALIRGLKERVEADPLTPYKFEPRRTFAGMSLAAFPASPPPEHCWLVFCEVWQSDSVQSALGQLSGVPIGALWDDLEWKSALSNFNRAIAEVSIDLAAYPARLERDASVWAFPSAAKAVQWCVACQERLAQGRWPDSLREVAGASYEPPPGEGELPVWCGLRARMSVAGGQCHREVDPFTGRFTYYGTPAVSGARLLAIARGGEILCSNEAYQSTMSASPQYVWTRFAGQRDMAQPQRTMSGPPVWRLTPKSLSGRLTELLRNQAAVASPGGELPALSACPEMSSSNLNLSIAGASPIAHTGSRKVLFDEPPSPGVPESPTAFAQGSSRGGGSQRSRGRSRVSHRKGRTERPEDMAVSPFRNDTVGMPLDWRPPDLDKSQPWPPEGTVTIVCCMVDRFQEVAAVDEPSAARALTVYRNELRRMLKERKGYESRCEGTLFVCSFQSSIDALGYVLETQRTLCFCDWPERALTHPAARTVATTGLTVLRGLRAQMGVHCCVSTARPDPLTGRVHYVAPEVAVAAAAASIALGGEIVITDTVANVLRSLGDEAAARLGRPGLTLLRPVSVPNAHGEFICHQILNDAIRHRGFYFGRDMGRAARQRDRGDAERECQLLQRRVHSLETQMQEQAGEMRKLELQLDGALKQRDEAEERAAEALATAAAMAVPVPADAGTNKVNKAAEPPATSPPPQSAARLQLDSPAETVTTVPPPPLLDGSASTRPAAQVPAPRMPDLSDTPHDLPLLDVPAVAARMQKEQCPSVVPPLTGRVTFVVASVDKGARMRKERQRAAEKALPAVRDAVIALAAEHKGYLVYEVPADCAFLLCFTETRDAVRWAVQLQQQLQSFTWPDELSAWLHTLSEPGVWNGPRVRIGCHAAELGSAHTGAVYDADAVTGAVTYRGVALCVAAAMHQLARGGEVLGTAPVAAVLYDELKDQLGSALSPPGGASAPAAATPSAPTAGAEATGQLAEKWDVYRITPAGLEKRSEEFREQEDEAEEEEAVQLLQFRDRRAVAVCVRAEALRPFAGGPGVADQVDRALRRVEHIIERLARELRGVPAQRAATAVPCASPRGPASLYLFEDAVGAMRYALAVQKELLLPEMDWPAPEGTDWEPIAGDRGGFAFWGPRVCVGICEVSGVEATRDTTPFSSGGCVHDSPNLHHAALLCNAARGGEVLAPASAVRSAIDEQVGVWADFSGYMRSTADSGGVTLLRAFPVELCSRATLLAPLTAALYTDLAAPCRGWRGARRRCAAAARLRHRVRVGATAAQRPATSPSPSRPGTPAAGPAQAPITQAALGALQHKANELRPGLTGHLAALRVLEAACMLAEDSYELTGHYGGDDDAPRPSFAIVFEACCEEAEERRRGLGAVTRKICGEVTQRLTIELDSSLNSSPRPKRLQRKQSSSSPGRLSPGDGPRQRTPKSPGHAQLRTHQKWRVATSAVSATMRFQAAHRGAISRRNSMASMTGFGSPSAGVISPGPGSPGHAQSFPADPGPGPHGVRRATLRGLPAETLSLALDSHELEQERKRRQADLAELKRVHRVVSLFGSRLREFCETAADESKPAITDDEFCIQWMRELRSLGGGVTAAPAKKEKDKDKDKEKEKEKDKDKDKDDADPAEGSPESKPKGGASPKVTPKVKRRAREEMAEMMRYAMDEQKVEQLWQHSHKVGRSIVGHLCGLYHFVSKAVPRSGRPPSTPPSGTAAAGEAAAGADGRRRSSRISQAAAKVRGVVRLSRSFSTAEGATSPSSRKGVTKLAGQGRSQSVSAMHPARQTSHQTLPDASADPLASSLAGSCDVWPPLLSTGRRDDDDDPLPDIHDTSSLRTPRGRPYSQQRRSLGRESSIASLPLEASVALSEDARSESMTVGSVDPEHRRPASGSPEFGSPYSEVPLSTGVDACSQPSTAVLTSPTAERSPRPAHGSLRKKGAGSQRKRASVKRQQSVTDSGALPAIGRRGNG